MAILIEKGIPFPGRVRNGKYNFGEMEVNDSFFVPGQKTVAVVKAEKEYGMRFKTRPENGGCRVWRIA